MNLAETPKPDRLQRLAELETLIFKGFQRALEAAIALAEISDNELWKDAGFEDFDSYCSQKWGFSRDYAMNLLRYGETVNLAQIAERSGFTHLLMPENEWQHRSMGRLKGPDQKLAALRTAHDLKLATGEPGDYRLFRRAGHAIRSTYREWSPDDRIQVVCQNHQYFGAVGVVVSQRGFLVQVAMDGLTDLISVLHSDIDVEPQNASKGLAEEEDEQALKISNRVEVHNPESRFYGRFGILEKQLHEIAHVVFDGESKSTPVLYSDLLEQEQVDSVSLPDPVPQRIRRAPAASEVEIRLAESDVERSRLEFFEQIAEKLVRAYDAGEDIAPLIDELRWLTGC